MKVLMLRGDADTFAADDAGEGPEKYGEEHDDMFDHVFDLYSDGDIEGALDALEETSCDFFLEDEEDYGSVGISSGFRLVDDGGEKLLEVVVSRDPLDERLVVRRWKPSGVEIRKYGEPDA